MSAGGGFLWFLLIVLLLAACASAYIYLTRRRAQRAGLPPPPLSSYIPFTKSQQNQSSRIYPAPSGIGGWFKNKFQSLKNSSSRTGAYEQPLGGSASGRRGLDPDEAWDSRVGAEADVYGAGGHYEEQELGLRPPGRNDYVGGGYGGNGRELPDYGHEEMGRGRSLSRDETPYIGGGQKGLDERYDEEMGREDPFGDSTAERSELRGVSPRPAEEGKGHKAQGSLGVPDGDSPTERRSMFHENV